MFAGYMRDVLATPPERVTLQSESTIKLIDGGYDAKLERKNCKWMGDFAGVSVGAGEAV